MFHGESPASNRFHIDDEGRVSIKLAKSKFADRYGNRFLELRRWMEAYLAYCRRQINPATVDSIVATIVNVQVEK